MYNGFKNISYTCMHHMPGTCTCTVRYCIGSEIMQGVLPIAAGQLGFKYYPDANHKAS